MMNNEVNPWESVLTGQQVEQNLANANLEGMSLRERLALKKASGQLGSQNYFAGYEGVPGAERPAALKEGYANGDPAEMAKLEDMYSQRFKTERDVENYGRKEQLKDQNKMNEFIRGADVMSRKYGMIPQEGGQTGNAMASQLGAGDPSIASQGAGTQTVPSSPVAFAPQTEEDYAKIPNTSLKFGFNAATGPNMEFMVGSAADRRKMANENVNRNAATQQATQTFQQNQIDQAHTNLRNTVQNYQKALNDDSEHKGDPVLTEELRQSMLQQRSALDAMAHGTTQPVASSAPNVSSPISDPSMVQGAVQSLDRNMGQQAQQLAATAHAVPSGRLTPYQESLIDMKDREGQATDARTSIDQAIKDSQSSTQALPFAKEMKRLMYTDEKGYPSLDGIWGADNVLALSPSNARIMDLNKIIGSLLIKEGQSRLNDTIVERKMQAAKVAGIYSDPQLNRMKASLLLSVFELKQKYPGFLEQWKREHQHTLQGAETAWEDYAQNNLRHTYTRDARGTVTGHTRSDVMDPKEWLTLRNAGKLQVVPPAQDGGAPQLMIRQPNGNYRVRR